MRHICKLEKPEIRTIIKNFCKKGMSPKEIHENFMETLWKRSRYSTVKQWAAEFKRGRESVEDDGWSGCPKYAPTDENIKVVHTLVMCNRKREPRSIASEVDIRFWAVQSILTKILGSQKFRQDGCHEC